MDRKEFVKMCGLLGISLPLHSMVSSCNDKDDDPITPASSSDKVLVIGAGPAGLTAAYQLHQRGIEVQVLEASSTYGGRIKRTTDFVDFPIPLGGEWLHVGRGVFNEIVNNSAINVDTQTTPYNPEVDYGLVNGVRVSVEDIGFTIDQKFIGSSWLDFFDDYVVPSIRNKIIFNEVVNTINYTDSEVVVTTANGEYTADKVIVTVPVKLLQQNAINFVPALPNKKVEAINKVTVWDGCKAFIEFSEKFYPTFIGYDIRPESAGQKLYYDAAYEQNSSRHVLGLFAVGTGTLPYVQLSDADLIDYMLTELDAMFDGKATSSYVKHTFQNWNAEPYAQGAYIYDSENWRTVRTLGESVNSKLYFAGDAYTEGEDWSSVHAAARSAIRAVTELV